MFRFEDPIYLYLLALIPLLALIRFFMVHQQKKRLRKFGDPELVRQLMPNVSRFRPMVKFYLLLGALALLIVVLARPQLGTKISHEKRTGIETIICMDISNSMLAEDVTPSRLDRAKMMVENLVDHFTNDKIGLIVFAGEAFVQLPITSDYVSAKMFLSSINPSMLSTQGTDIAAAITMASHSFTQEENIGKAIIVITDGEDHEGGALEAAKEAKERGMNTYVLGVGSPNGAPIPAGTGDYMKDNSGQTVMSALNEDMCRQLADAGSGAYIHVENNSNAQEQLDNELDKLAKKETSSTIYSDYDEQFQAVAIIVLLLLILEVCILEIKNPMLKNVSLFKRSKRLEVRGERIVSSRLILLLFISLTSYLSPLTTNAQSDRQMIRQGNKLYRKGNVAEAEVSYRKAVERNERNAQANYNLGNALMGQRKDSLAITQLEKAAKLETNPLRRAQAYHNMGVICQQHRMFGEAIEAYKEALRNNPTDNETRYNLALCKRQQQEQQQDQNQQNKDNKDNKDKQDQQKQDQQQKQDEKKQEQQQKQQMSKENAEQLLNAAMQEEKQTQERMKKAQQQPQKRRLEKNW
jgi:Ca-activated chloride channel family protein